jgi:hypothetical protein
MVWTSLFGVISFELNGQRPQAAGRNPVTVAPYSPSASGTGSLSCVPADRVPDLDMVFSEMLRVLPSEIEQELKKGSSSRTIRGASIRVGVVTAVRQATRIHPPRGEESLARRQQD